MIRKKFICTLALALTAGMLAQAVVVIASEDIIGERQIIETTPINPEETIIEDELTPLAGEKIEEEMDEESDQYIRIVDEEPAKGITVDDKGIDIKKWLLMLGIVLSVIAILTVLIKTLLTLGIRDNKNN